MNKEQLIEMTKDLIFHATHFDLPYVQETYADKLLVVNVDESSGVDTMNKEQLVAFIRQNKEANTPPFSTKTEFHYAVGDENMGMVVMTRELEMNGKWSRKFFTVIWENVAGKWQIVKESSVVRG
ncbi:MAG TPA: hypothetical protein VHE34_13860 [Puia sp.]|uniref:hypothetical protein n=1 Tax=Puia sp. TaxID=2045100 RepID=UPI002CF80E15|nr:hypothetical protein [Puia sp.]HVU96310.1 hypothetical protein [Puia sp.]